jgi:hypothetical protein
MVYEYIERKGYDKMDCFFPTTCKLYLLYVEQAINIVLFQFLSFRKMIAEYFHIHFYQ